MTARFLLRVTVLTVGVTTVALAHTQAPRGLEASATSRLGSDAPTFVRSSGELEVAFSPNGGATQLVTKVIGSAKRSIRVAGYSFTSTPIAKALVEGHRRGVDVKVVLDKSQRSARYTSATFLANMGVPVRIDSRHAIMHNKYVVVDGHTVEQGSFNFTRAAEEHNAENVLVNWDNEPLADLFLRDWQRHWEHSEPYVARY